MTEPLDDMDMPLDDELLRAAADYHRPPAAVPRDAMWAAIVARRAAATVAAADGAAAADPLGAPLRALDAYGAARARGTRWARPAWSLAAAALLLLALGVGAGRWWGARATRSTADVAAGRVPDAVGRDVAAPPTRVAVAAPAGEGVAHAVHAEPVGTPDGLTTVDGAARGRTPDEASGMSAGTAPRAPRRPARDAARRDGPSLAYDVAALRHLTAVEALLVAYRAGEAGDSAAGAGASAAAADARVARWARTLLQDTRLLLDSPAAAAPRTRRLFEDLELVLVQMARLAPDSAAAADAPNGPNATAAPAGARARREAEERALIDGTMRDARVLPRLRRAIPAGLGT